MKYSAQLAKRVIGNHPFDIGTMIEITHPDFLGVEGIIIGYWKNWLIYPGALSRSYELGTNICTSQGDLLWFPLRHLQVLDLPPVLSPYTVLDLEKIPLGTKWLSFRTTWKFDGTRVFTYIGQSVIKPLILCRQQDGICWRFKGRLNRPVSIIIDY